MLQAIRNIVPNHVHSFMATIHPSYNGYFQHDYVPCHNAKFTSNWFSKQEFSVFQWSFQYQDLNLIEDMWCIVEFYVTNARRALSRISSVPNKALCVCTFVIEKSSWSSHHKSFVYLQHAIISNEFLRVYKLNLHILSLFKVQMIKQIF